MVVYFTLDQTATGRKKRKGNWIYHTEQRVIPCGSFRLLVTTVYLPGFCRKKKKWERVEWLSYCNSLPIPEEGNRVLYYWQEDMTELLGRALEPLSYEWITFLLSFYQISFSELVILDDRDMPTEELISCFVSRTRVIRVVTGDKEQYDEISEALYEEFGFLLSIVEDAKDLRLNEMLEKSDETLLVIAGKNLYHLTPAMIPANTIWFSTEAESSYEKRIGMRAKVKKVISMQSFWRDMSDKHGL